MVADQDERFLVLSGADLENKLGTEFCLHHQDYTVKNGIEDRIGSVLTPGFQAFS